MAFYGVEMTRRSNRRLMLAMTATHRFLLRLTGHRLGRRLGRMRLIELSTVGRRSAEVRRAILTVPVEEGGSYVIVASRGGDDAMPAWYLNLEAAPIVGVGEAGVSPVAYRARTASAEERARLWPRCVAAYRGYASYQRKTKREIPLVILEPAPGETPPDA